MKSRSNTVLLKSSVLTAGLLAALAGVASRGRWPPRPARQAKQPPTNAIDQPTRSGSLVASISTTSRADSAATWVLPKAIA